MIMLEFQTASGSRYLVDVVNAKLKKIETNHQPQPDAQWWPYKQIMGWQVEQCWVIDWGDGHTSQTTEVEKYNFIRCA